MPAASRSPEITVVLVEPRYPGNLGSVARAMKNMGLKRLAAVKPIADPDAPEAIRLACDARDVLRGLKRHDSVGAAVARCDLVVGTTRRTGKDRDNFITARDLPGAIRARHARRVAILFGPEERGLDNVELAPCQLLVRIPSHPGYESLNLAQAVMVVAYEWFVGEKARASSIQPRTSSSSVTSKTLEAMYADLEATLLEIGFLQRNNPFRMMRVIRNLLGRTPMNDREVQVLRGICRQIRWYGGRSQ